MVTRRGAISISQRDLLVKRSIISARYGGKKMAEAGPTTACARAYVAWSPRSFSGESVRRLTVHYRRGKCCISEEIVAKSHKKTTSMEFLHLSRDTHAADILDSNPDMAAQIAAWLEAALGEPGPARGALHRKQRPSAAPCLT